MYELICRSFASTELPIRARRGAPERALCVEEAIPILRVANADSAVAWYERLGYEKEWEHRFEPSFPAFVSLARHGTSRLFLSEHREDAGGLLVAGTVVYLRVGDVDAIAKDFDVDIVDMPWAREVHLTDPDGNRLRIGTPSATANR